MGKKKQMIPVVLVTAVLLLSFLRTGFLWPLKASALGMRGPSGSGLPYLNEPAAPEEPLLEPQEASGGDILRVRRRLERYAQRSSGQTTPPEFNFFEVSLPKTFGLEQGVSRARLQALDSFIEEEEARIEEEEGRVLARKSTIHGILQLKKKMANWDAEHIDR